MKLVFDYNNIANEQGVAIAITGLIIVFTALFLITLFIALLPKILKTLEPILPAAHEPHGSVAREHAPKGNQELLIAAAAAAAYHKYQEDGK